MVQVLNLFCGGVRGATNASDNSFSTQATVNSTRLSERGFL